MTYPRNKLAWGEGGCRICLKETLGVGRNFDVFTDISEST